MPQPSRRELDARLKVLEGERASIVSRLESLEQEIARLKQLQKQGGPPEGRDSLKPQT